MEFSSNHHPPITIFKHLIALSGQIQPALFSMKRKKENVVEETASCVSNDDLFHVYIYSGGRHHRLDCPCPLKISRQAAFFYLFFFFILNKYHLHTVGLCAMADL